MRGSPLGIRLAALMAVVVVIVLVAAGVAVNRAASRSLEETLGPRDQERLNLAAALIEEGLERGADLRGMQRLLQRIALETRGQVRVVDASGAVILRAGGPPTTDETQTLTSPLSEAAGGGAVEIDVPSAAAPIVRAFNGALIITGVVAVATLLVVAAIGASRMTRPLRDVAAAAHRLGSGDLSVRARGGADAESAELADAFNEMAEQLERSEILRRRAASDLAHDLATPATVLESQIQAMVDGVVPADAAQLERARAAATSLSSVIGQLGELTQAEAAPLQRRVEPFDLADLATEVLAALHGMLRERGVEGVLSGAGGTVLADRAQVERALRNVLTNAIQHSPAGGRVAVELRETNPVELRVGDHGPGIGADDVPYIFERFYRADRSRGKMPGSGIGLTVARELIVANGGSIEVESSSASGTTFLVRLPSATVR
ncbi:MAG: HAMP domain-containing histidine kinase [Chloroflexi bacterium]|nr:HAMP domain-containing histidine kinase [Chloroflexota bacterium]